METCNTPDNDAAALKARRERLRAVASQIAEVVETIPMPDTFLEAERAARTVTVADRMILRLPPDEPEAVKPARQRLRVFGDRLLDAIERLTLPDTFLGAERASRCVLATDHMLAQLYEAPKLPKQPAFADDIDDDPDVTDIYGRMDVMAKIDRLSIFHARENDIWYDGTPFDPDRPVAPLDFEIADRASFIRVAEERPEEFEGDKTRIIAEILIGRVNTITRLKAQQTGRWPDYSPYSDDNPDFYSISDRFDEEVMHRPPQSKADPPVYVEQRGPTGFAWWLVRRKPLDGAEAKR